MDKKKLSEEIEQNMRQENDRVSLPLETWNKFAEYADERERLIYKLQALTAGRPKLIAVVKYRAIVTLEAKENISQSIGEQLRNGAIIMDPAMSELELINEHTLQSTIIFNDEE